MHRALALASALVLALPAAALADTVRVDPGADLQAALDAAGPGDTVLLSSGSYVIDQLVLEEGRDGVTIRGRGKVFIEGPLNDGRGTPYPASLLVRSSDVTLQGLIFRHGRGTAVEAGIEGRQLTGLRIDRCQFRNTHQTSVDATVDDVVITRTVFRGCNEGAARVVGDRAEFSKLTMRGLGGFGIRVEGNDARYSRNSLRTVEDGRGVEIIGNGALVERSTFGGVQRSHVEVTGDHAVVRRCSMSLGDDDAIHIQGANALVERIRMEHISDNGVVVVGDDARVERCVMDRMGSRGIDVDGNTATVVRNRVLTSQSRAIDVSGDDARVEGNRAFAGDAAMGVSGARAVVHGNVVDAAGDDATGLLVGGDQLTVTGNRVRDANAHGLTVSGDDGLVADNVITQCGSENEVGLRVSGSGNRVRDNRVSDCDSTGLEIHGGGNDVRSNRVEHCTDNGIRVVQTFDRSGPEDVLLSVDNVLEDNVVRGNEGEGIENEGAATELRGNRVTGNRLDITNRNDLGATLVDAGGNVFRTGGLDAPPQILR